MKQSVIEYYRCPEKYLNFALTGELSEGNGFFRVGPKAIGYGRYAGHAPAEGVKGHLIDACADMFVDEDAVHVPFDIGQVTDNLKYERYVAESTPFLDSRLARFYYFVRPTLPVSVRKHLQKIRLNGWRKFGFPQWPVDRSVDIIFEQALMLSLRRQKLERIPFIWFWPLGAPGCAIMTHDVEAPRGKSFCSVLMDIDDEFGIKASFQVVPEERYEVTPEFLDSIRKRGFEIGVQDLNHDGLLYRNRKQFMERVQRINAYGRKWEAKGFRGAVLYRRQEWFDALDFSYDMSVPNVAHLDPQRGGCCTVMPYFVGKLLELPVTATQDYSLLHILRHFSIDLWKQQIDLILQNHGLLSFIVHPDYVTEDRERDTYKALLGHLADLREKKDIWITTPEEVNRWWRQRANLKLSEKMGGWQIQGEGKERARIAWASEVDGRLEVTVEPVTVGQSG